MKRPTVTLPLLTVVLTMACLLCLAMPAGAITNGTNDSGHPYVCLVQLADDWRVTGVQLSPTVVLTAGHGTAGFSSAKVWFSAQPDMSTPEAVATELSTYPGYAAGLGDVGIVTLPTPHPLSDYAQLPGLGDVDELPMLQAVDLVGYGANYEARGRGTPVWQWLNYVTGSSTAHPERERLDGSIPEGDRQPGRRQGRHRLRRLRWPGPQGRYERRAWREHVRHELELHGRRVRAAGGPCGRPGVDSGLPQLKRSRNSPR